MTTLTCYFIHLTYKIMIESNGTMIWHITTEQHCTTFIKIMNVMADEY